MSPITKSNLLKRLEGNTKFISRRERNERQNVNPNKVKFGTRVGLKPRSMLVLQAKAPVGSWFQFPFGEVQYLLLGGDINNKGMFGGTKYNRYEGHEHM